MNNSKKKKQTKNYQALQTTDTDLPFPGFLFMLISLHDASDNLQNIKRTCVLISSHIIAPYTPSSMNRIKKAVEFFLFCVPFLNLLIDTVITITDDLISVLM